MSFEMSQDKGPDPWADDDPWAVPKFTEGTNVSRVIPRAKPRSIEEPKDKFRLYREEVTDYFFKWRRYGGRPGSSWDGATLSRRVKSRIKKLPIKSLWKHPGSISPIHGRGRRRLKKESDGGYKEDYALEASDWLKEKLQMIQMRHIKILGWGGLGVVNLFEQERPDGQLIKVVCKADLEPGKHGLAGEINAHISTAGAMHVAQWIPPSHFSRPNGRPYYPEPGSVSNFDPIWDKSQVLFLEFMGRGDLRKIACRVSHDLVGGGNFPPLTLWHIFSNRKSPTPPT